MKNYGNVYWICGLAGSGKTSVAEKLSETLVTKGINSVLLDGDYIREIFDLPKDYSYEGRKKLAKIYSKITKMLSDQGFTVIVSVIALFDEIFEFNRKNIKNYVEVFLDVPMSELVRRDKKNLYSKALSGEIKDVVGIDIKAEFPKNPDIKIMNYGTVDIDDSVKKLVEHFETNIM
tara:strand:- start:382 stop:909 length:528 start_codon:yes stop_codon:yes gene_type:complete